MRIQNLPFRGYFSFAIILSVISAALILIVKANLPPVIPLFYGRPVGSGQLVPVLGLFLIPAVTVTLTLANILIANSLKQGFMQKILAVSSLFVSILGTITLVKIIMLVGFW